MAVFDVISYTLSSKIAEAAVSGVDSMSVDGTTLKINCVDGTVLEMNFPVPKDGADGVSVVDIDLNEQHELIFIMSDGSEIAAGQIDVIKGDKGDQGEQGEKGDTGYSPTISENASNTEDNYKLDITNEKNSFTTPNLKGKPGAQGLQGVRGEKGDKGDTGLTGEKGADGVSPTVIENTENSDTTYKLDITDANGTHTTPNLIGKQGPQGLKGDKGDKGDTGIQGVAGEAGADGVSPLISSNTANTEDVYKLDITDANGTFTTPNLMGRQGPQGIQGEVGPQGERGIQGIQGIQGEKGEDGYPFLIYREYSSIDDFDPAHFPEIGLMFMIKAEEGQSSYPIYRYTGMADTPYSFVTDLATSEGLKGEKGEKGDKGDQGVQGEKGIDGITYTPVIGTVTTVDSMSDAAADIVVNSDAKTATFNFSLPKGANGAIGGKGDKGAKGDTGEKGDPGVDGITYTPAIGTVTTVDSASEAAASVDIDSENARATFNFSIPRGQNGLQGIQGIQGEQGIPGEAGKDGVDGTTYTPAIGTVTTVNSNEEASVSVSTTMDDSKLAVFDFNIPRGVGVEKIEFTSSTLGDVAGISGATDTYTITFTDASTATYEVYNGQDCGLKIDDETASETTVWSSKKTSGELGKKSNTINISMVGLGFTKGAEVPLEDFMIAISEKMSNNYSTIYKVNWTDENSAYVVFGNKKVNINGGVLYCSQSNTITNTWTDLTILYTPNVSSPNLYKFTARKDGSILSVYMFEYPYMADTTSSETSTYSSAKIDEKINDTAKLVYFSRNANRGYLKITNTDDGRPVSISDICGGKIEIYGNGRVVASDNNYFAKVLRLSYGNWTTFDATIDTVTYKKIFKTYLDETNKTFYVEVGSHTRFCVEGAKTVEMLELDDIDIAQFTEISESAFATKSDLGSNVALTNITFDSTYATATSGGHGCTYVIRNGICYVNMDMRIVANGKICTLPKPLMSVVNIPMTVFMHNITGEVEAVNNGILMVNSDGSATTLGALTNESRYMMNFSYPIA